MATFRRPESLARLLASLERQKLAPDQGFEVIVVDNDAAQSAAPTALAHARRFAHLDYLVEPRRNIAHARNRAVERARGEWLAFIDDDEEAYESWLAALLALLDAHECDGAFGPVLPRFDSPAPIWLDAFFSRPRQPSASPVARDATRSGNAIVRRGWFDGRAFDPRFGRTGGSDAKLFGAMLDAGARFLWCDEAVVCETVSDERRSLRWLARRAFRGGYVFELQHPAARPPLAALRAASLAVAFALRAPAELLNGRRAGARCALRACTQAGRLWALLGGAFEEYAG